MKPFRFFTRRMPLKLKFGLIIFLPVCCVVGILAALGIYWDIHSIKQNARKEFNTVVKVASPDLVDILTMGSPQSTAKALTRFRAFPNIVEIALYDNHESLVFHLNRLPDQIRPAHSANRPSEHFDGKYFHVYEPVIHLGETYGHVYFKASADTFDKRMQGYFDLLNWAIPLLLLAMLVVAAWFQRYFTGPILALSRFVKTTTRKADYSDRLAVTDESEMGQLYRGLNELLDKIEDTNRHLNAEKERLQVTLESIGEGVIATDADGIIQYMNPLAEKLTAWQKNDAVGLPLDTVYHVYNESDEIRLRHKVAACLSGAADINSDQLILVARDGRKIAIKNTFSPICDTKGANIGCVVVVHNVTEARELAKRLSHQATHDALTDLANRSYFENRLIHILANFHDNLHGALLYIDLDQFKIVNDTCGHTAGDALLKQVSNVLLQSTREIDVVARLGGDEFGIILENCPLANAMEIAEKLRNRIAEQTFVWNDKPFKLGVSIGLVPFCGTFADHNEMLSAADVACYAAKDLGRNRIHVYREDDQHFMRRHDEMHWVARINKAIDEQRLRLYIQPIIPIDDRFQNAVYEVLIRIEENGVLIPPGAFLPAAERYNIINAVDIWVVQNLFKHPAIKEKILRHPDTVYHVNLSGTTLSHKGFTENLERYFSESGMSPQNICFEITETSAVSNLAEASQFIDACRQLGCQFALDDFGSGVSSFNYLKNLKVDFLKIDGCFIRDMLNDPIDNAMVTAINNVGHVMGIRTVAEFVENRATLNRLQEIGVDYAQGFYLHEPSPLTHENSSLTQHRNHNLPN